ncbi:Peptidase S12 Pab87-related C-terminal [Penicillium macrosclerotiorum]|uniref:Peptidase S12 Pab87-related C-terminal n=1 Tax=Penicillium macrosclerotiorum TaxID=303699 RepID=UPI0025496751|nr:Peptidase S12 Pab87-related C-terminal [Penicillium macrosclerotiorum]KAJ5679288.1 Peptidase S12 Pab87-related C-terminal [Penicillium macrosclerotiorum]
MIAAGIAKLVDEGKIEWTTRVQTILPEFVHDNARFARVVTVGDLLAHRSGLDGVAALCLAMQGDGEMLVPNDAFFQTVQHIPWPTPPRQSWSYCVWGYSIAAYIIEKISGRPPHEYLEEELFVPLGMDRTSLQPRFDHLENVAKPYASLTNGNAHLLKHRQQFAGTFFEGSGGAFTTVNDLLLWAKAMLAASQEAKDTEKTIIKQGSHLLGNQISIESTCDSEQSYGFGWVRSQLPGAVGVVGDNADIWGPSELPIFGARNAPQLMIYHQGATVGYYSFLALFPETQSAVVVLTNAIAFSDPAEWIGRIIIQGLFDFAEPIDYVDWSEKSKEKESNSLDPSTTHSTRSECLILFHFLLKHTWADTTIRRTAIL